MVLRAHYELVSIPTWCDSPIAIGVNSNMVRLKGGLEVRYRVTDFVSIPTWCD